MKKVSSCLYQPGALKSSWVKKDAVRGSTKDFISFRRFDRIEKNIALASWSDSQELGDCEQKNITRFIMMQCFNQLDGNTSPEISLIFYCNRKSTLSE